MNEEQIKKEENTDKTFFLRVISALQIIACIIIAIVSFTNEKIVDGVMILIVGFVIFAFINGFKDIIELLDSINNKLK